MSTAFSSGHFFIIIEVGLSLRLNYFTFLLYNSIEGLKSLNPTENIYFFLLGMGVLFAIIIVCFLFRKRKKIVIGISITFVMALLATVCTILQ